MLLPFREHLDFGPTPYDLLQAKEGIPIVRGNVIADVLDVALGKWERMGVLGSFVNLSNQQRTDAYICEIPPAGQTLPQRHLFEEIVYVAKGRGATSVWQEGVGKVTFEWATARFLRCRSTLLTFTSMVQRSRCVCLSAPLARQ